MLKLTAVVLGLAITAAPAAPQTPPTGQRFTLAGNMLCGCAGLQRTQPRDIVDQLFAAYRARDVDGIAGLMAADVVFEDPGFRQRRVGRDGIRTLAAEMRSALSDVTIDVHSMVVSGDLVATEQTLGGVLDSPRRRQATDQSPRLVVFPHSRRPDPDVDRLL